MTLNFEHTRLLFLKGKFDKEHQYFSNPEPTNHHEIIEPVDANTRFPIIVNILERLNTRLEEDGKDYRKVLFEEIDKYTYKKPWNRLQPFHRIVKLQEYIQETYGEGELQDKIIFDLKQLIESGRINTKSSVNYCHKTERIESIPILDVDMETGTYSIAEKDKKKKNNP